MKAERRAELEEERQFLLDSLDDLDREYEAGDVDDDDYRTLRDGYTSRAAATMRALGEGDAAAPDDDEAPNAGSVVWLRRLALVAGTLALIGVIWWALSATLAQRLPGQEITGGDEAANIEAVRAQARSLQFQQPGAAAAMYQTILDEVPDDANALTYGGWTRALAAITAPDEVDVEAELITATEMLSTAIDVDPDYPDPYCLRGVVVANFLQRPDAATDDLSACLDGNPPADIAGLVQGLLDSIEAGQ